MRLCTLYVPVNGRAISQVSCPLQMKAIPLWHRGCAVFELWVNRNSQIIGVSSVTARRTKQTYLRLRVPPRVTKVSRYALKFRVLYGFSDTAFAIDLYSAGVTSKSFAVITSRGSICSSREHKILFHSDVSFCPSFEPPAERSFHHGKTSS